MILLYGNVNFDTKFDFADFNFKEISSTKSIPISLKDSYDNAIVNQSIVYLYINRKNLIFDLSDFSIKENISIEDLIYPRKLITFYSKNLTYQHYNVLDKDEKVTLSLFKFKIVSDKNIENYTFILLIPKKGYEEESKALASLLESNGFEILDSVSIINLFSKLRIINNYKSKIINPFRKKDNIYISLQKIFLGEIEILKSNIHGVVKDIDTEFLHDYRVSIRRSMSIFKDFKYLFPKEIYLVNKAFLSNIFKFTNNLRDLDVFLLFLHNYKDGDIDIKSIEKTVKDKRGEALGNVKVFFKSDEHKKSLSKWDMFVNKGLIDIMRNAENFTVKKSVKKVLKKKIKFLKELNIDYDNISNEELHSIRILCKHFRYIAEHFQSIFNDEASHNFIETMKNFQDYLGKNQDISFQINMLNLLKEISPSNDIETLILKKIVERDNNLSLFSEYYQKFQEELKCIKIKEILK